MVDNNYARSLGRWVICLLFVVFFMVDIGKYGGQRHYQLDIDKNQQMCATLCKVLSQLPVYVVQPLWNHLKRIQINFQSGSNSTRG